MFWRIFIASVLGRWRRILLASAAMVAGTGAVAAFLNLSLGMRERMRAEVRAFGASGVILPGVGVSSAGSTLSALPGHARLTEEGRSKIEAILSEGKVPHADLLYCLGELGETEVIVLGTHWEAAFRLNPTWLVEGVGEGFDPKGGILTMESRDGDEVPALLGEGVWRSLGISGGEVIPLSFAGGDPLRLKVVGRVRTGGEEDDQVILPLESLRKGIGLPGATSAIPFRTLGGEEEIARVSAAVAGAVPGWSVQTIRQVVEAEAVLLGRLELLLGFVAFAVLLGSSLAVMATMLATVMEREREIGLFRALGGGARIIRSQLLLEGALAGVSGGVAGLLVGWAGSWGIARVAFGAGVGLSPWSVPVTMILGIGAAAAAVIVPLRRVARVDLTATLRGRE